MRYQRDVQALSLANFDLNLLGRPVYRLQKEIRNLEDSRARIEESQFVQRLATLKSNLALATAEQEKIAGAHTNAGKHHLALTPVATAVEVYKQVFGEKSEEVGRALVHQASCLGACACGLRGMLPPLCCSTLK